MIFYLFSPYENIINLQDFDLTPDLHSHCRDKQEQPLNIKNDIH